MYRKTKSEGLEKWCGRFGRFSWCVGLQPVSTFVAFAAILSDVCLFWNTVSGGLGLIASATAQSSVAHAPLLNCRPAGASALAPRADWFRVTKSMQQHVSQRINHTHQQRRLCLDCIGESILKRRVFTAWIICVMCTSKLKARPANEAFVPSKGLKCNLLLTYWRRLTTTDHHHSASIMYGIWGLMWTCSKADAAVGGF